MSFRWQSSALILIVLASCAQGEGDVGAVAPPPSECFSLSAAQAVDLSAGSPLLVGGSDGRLFELKLSGDCEAFDGPPLALVEAGSSSPFCVGDSAGRELIVRHPVTQQSSICRVEAVRLVGLNLAR